jgi:hypothetical protein
MGWGRYGQVCLFDIFPSPALSLVFERGGGPLGITVIYRLISNHTRVRARLSKINIVAKALCGCGCNYESVEHILWS